MLKEKSQSGGIEKRRKACGYRVYQTCIDCASCERTFNVKGREKPLMIAWCDLHDFEVNQERGHCKDFDHIGKYQG